MLKSVLIATAVLGLASGSKAAALDPAALRADIQAKGAKAVVEALFQSGDWENVVVKRIGDGSIPWIRLTPRLAEGTDAATSEELGESLIYALPKAPRAVLSVIDLSAKSGPLRVDEVCSASFYEGDRTNPALYKRAAIRAVSHMEDPPLADAKRACLTQLRGTPPT